MNIYFDESGNTGCVLLKDGKLNFDKQPIFVIGAVITENNEDERELINKYQEFKTKFSIDKEIKGNELNTRKRNEELNYLLENVFDDKHFALIVYDKRFYISTLLMISLLGPEFQKEFPLQFYIIADALSFQNDDFFVEYCKYIENPNSDTFHEYLVFLKQYNYTKLNEEQNVVKKMAETILNNGDEKLFYSDFLTFGWYDNKNIANLLNLNALAELIFFIKNKSQESNTCINFIHDKIFEFEATIKKELIPFGININFPHTHEPLLLQLADNLSSVTCHCFIKMKEHFIKKEEWKETSLWDLNLVSRIISTLDIKNIKLTLPFVDWSLSLSVKEMFANSYPKAMRNNVIFNNVFTAKQKDVMASLCEAQKDVEKIQDILKR